MDRRRRGLGPARLRDRVPEERALRRPAAQRRRGRRARSRTRRGGRCAACRPGSGSRPAAAAAAPAGGRRAAGRPARPRRRCVPGFSGAGREGKRDRLAREACEVHHPPLPAVRCRHRVAQQRRRPRRRGARRPGRSPARLPASRARGRARAAREASASKRTLSGARVTSVSRKMSRRPCQLTPEGTPARCSRAEDQPHRLDRELGARRRRWAGSARGGCARRRRARAA